MSDALETGAPPNPRGVNSREELATALTALRQAANLSVREVVAASGVPHGTVSGWMSGQHAPVGAYRERFDAVLLACGITDEADRQAWWEAAARARQTRSTRGADGRPPYQGLQPFEAGDSAWFFGRDRLIDRALAELVALSRRPPDGPPALMTVIGASGSGKSSLIRAGIIPALGRRSLGGTDAVLDSWRAVLMTPGAHPNQALAALTIRRQTVLCIDQFEELWTQVESEAERTAFLASLRRLAGPGQDWIVLIGLRADFYGAASRRPELQHALQENQLLVGPMSTEELREAIVEPARRAGARVDEDLVKVLLGDLASRSVTAAHDPGGLPLLSHALLSTWERSNRRRLTVSDYYATGGITSAIERAAESTYERLSAEQQECVPRLFLRLINLDGETVSRRRLPLGEVLDDSASDTAMGAAVDAFCDARLLTRDVETVEITHEALITAWPRLNGWIVSNRAGLVIHRRITLAARQWAASGRDEDHLLPANRLASWREWARLEGHSIHLNRLEQEFLGTSETSHQRASELADRQHRSRRRLGTMALVLAVLCALLSMATTGAYLNARRYRADAELARDEARSRQVALEAARLRTEDPALSSQLALAAYRISPTLEARSALLDATAEWTPTRITGHAGPLQARTSPDGATLATADAIGRLRLFSLSGGTPVPVSSVSAAPADRPDLYALAWSADGRLLAVGGQSAPTLWDVTDRSKPQRIRTLPLAVTTYGLAFVPGGHTLLAGTADGRVVAWPDATRSRPTDLVTGVAEGVSALAVSADGRRLAVAGAADRLAVWRLRDGHAVDRLVGRLPAGRGLSVAFSPDSRELAAGTAGGEIRRWRVGTDRLAALPTLGGFGSYVNALAYQNDARRLVAGSSDQTTAVYDLGTARRLSTMPGPAIVVSVEVVDDRIVTASTDGTTRLWPLPDPNSHDAIGPGWQLGVSADQHTIAEATGRGDGKLRLYDVDRTGRAVPRAVLVPPVDDGTISGTGSLSADGNLLAGGTTTGRIVLWDVSNGQPSVLSAVSQLGSRRSAGSSPPSQLQALAISPDNRRLASVDATRAYTAIWDIANPMSPRRQPTTLPAGAIALALAFSPDSRLLAVGDAKDEVAIWDVADPTAPRRLATLDVFDDDANAVAFSPDGRLLAAGSADRSIRLWDVSVPDHPRPVARLTGPEAAVYSVSFSSDGNRLAAGSGDGSLWLFDVSAPQNPVTVATLGAADERVNDARFVDADQRLVGTGPSGQLRFWQTDTAAAIEEVCSRRGDPLDAREWNRYLTGIPARQICP